MPAPRGNLPDDQDAPRDQIQHDQNEEPMQKQKRDTEKEFQGGPLKHFKTHTVRTYIEPRRPWPVT